jgi:hypothetical protein
MAAAVTANREYGGGPEAPNHASSGRRSSKENGFRARSFTTAVAIMGHARILPAKPQLRHMAVPAEPFITIIVAMIIVVALNGLHVGLAEDGTD